MKMSLMLGLSDVRDNTPLLSSFDVFCKSYLKREILNLNIAHTAEQNSSLNRYVLMKSDSFLTKALSTNSPGYVPM